MKINRGKHSRISIDRQNATCEFTRTFRIHQQLIHLMGMIRDSPDDFLYLVCGITDYIGAHLLIVTTLRSDLCNLRHVILFRKDGVSCGDFVVAPSAVTMPLPEHKDRSLDFKSKRHSFKG